MGSVACVVLIGLTVLGQGSLPENQATSTLPELAFLAHNALYPRDKALAATEATAAPLLART